jgi:hypothetical protein
MVTQAIENTGITAKDDLRAALARAARGAAVLLSLST